VANQRAQGHKLVAVELRSPSADVGATIELRRICLRQLIPWCVRVMRQNASAWCNEPAKTLKGALA
jgi:hypothetical protein